jgi:hypothetical protein
MAGVAAALMAACSALGSAYTVEEGCREAQGQARMKALKSLQHELFALNVGEKKTVKDFIEATDLPKTELVRSLLQGAVEYRPPRVYGDGDCEVRVGLSGDALRANLKRILEQNYRKEGGEFSKTAFDAVGGKGLEAEAEVPVSLPPRTDADVSEGVPGWDQDASGQPISALKRIETEHAAYLQGLAALKGDVEQSKIGEGQTLGALMDSNPLVKETIGKFLANLLPDRKLYWPKGIVEVRFVLDAGALWAALEQANRNSADPKQRLPADLLATARERTKNRTLASSGFAQLDGKPVSSADVVETAVPLDLNGMAEPPLPQFEQAR